MIGPACTDRKRIATPQAQSRNATLTSTASVYRPTRSTPPPFTFIPAANATPVTTAAVISQRSSAPIA